MMAYFAGLEAANSTALNWQLLTHVVRNVAQERYVSRELASQWKERLKSESTHVVLNTLTALHTLSLNGGQQVRDQIALSKCLKHLDRLLNRPPFPGVETAAAQLLMDWAFLYGAEELGLRSFNILTSTSKHRAMLQAMQASTVAVMLREDQKIGMPQFVTVRKGLDFAAQFTSAQYGSPLTGVTSPPGVLDFLAKAAVAASYSGSSTAAAAAAAASRNTFAAWAERVQQDPAAAAERVLSARQLVETDIQALAAAQAACLAAARPFLNKAANNSSSSNRHSNSKKDSVDECSDLRHELDKAYLVACKCTEWREMIQVLLQHQLPDIYTSALLTLADTVNATLEEWQAAATTEIFWLLGVDTAGLADGSSLKQVLVDAHLAPVAAAAGSSTTQQQQRRQSAGAAAAAANAAAGVTRASYLDLLTGDALPLNSTDSSVSNPFLSGSTSPTIHNVTNSSLIVATAASTQGSRQGSNPFTASALPPPAAAAGSAAIPPELQCYIQEATAAAPGPLPAAAAAGPPPAATAGVSGYPAVAAAADPAAVGGSGSSSIVSTRYPAVPSPAVQPWRQQQQQWSAAQVTSQQKQQPARLNMQAYMESCAAAQQSIQQQQPQLATRSDRVADSSTISGSRMAAASTGSANTTAAAAAAGGGTGSSTDSPVGYNYINPFAALDTNNIISRLKLTSPRSSSDGAAAVVSGSSTASAAAAAVAAGKRSVSSGSTGDAAVAQQQQQHTGAAKKRDPPPPPSSVVPQQPPPAAAAAATLSADGISSDSNVQSTYAAPQHPEQATAAAVSGTAATHVHQSLSPRRQQQQQSLLSLQEIELLQHKLHQVLSSTVAVRGSSTAAHSASSSSSIGNTSMCQSCDISSNVAVQSALLQLLVQQEQQHKQQLLLLEHQHKQEVKKVKEMALEKLRELQQQLATTQQQLSVLQQTTEQQH